MYDLIIIAGAPGSGKTTISKILSKKLDSPCIDFGNLRWFHLDPYWKKANDNEEKMTFENLIFMIYNYKKYGYTNVIINDFEDFRIQEAEKYFGKLNYRIFTLILKEETELKRRVLDPKRDSGFRNYEKAIDWNRKIIERGELKNEIFIENSIQDIEKTLQIIMKIINE